MARTIDRHEDAIAISEALAIGADVFVTSDVRLHFERMRSQWHAKGFVEVPHDESCAASC